MLSRRTFLATAGAFLATPAIANREIPINIYNPHTQETTTLHYRDSISRRDWYQFCAIARDWRQERAVQMDSQLLLWLRGLTEQLGTGRPFILLSGFRTQATNQMLSGTASNSLHLQGRALDIRRDDYSTSDLRDAAHRLALGGVGYYPQANNRFVHIDTGPWRTW